MLTLPVLSQSIKSDSVTIGKKTFKSIIKESIKCDSLKIAYIEKSTLLDSLVIHQASIFTELSREREKRLAIERKLRENHKNLIKLAKKNKGKTIYVTGGILLGIVTGVLITK